MMHRCFLAIFVLLQGFTATAQTYHFDMFLFGDKIGTMIISREQQPDSTEHYVMETRSKARFMWIDREGYTRYEVWYKQGRLQSSTHIQKENGATQRWTNVRFNGKTYDVDSYKGKRSFAEAPQLSVVSLYYKPLKNGARIFYEAEADYSILQAGKAGPDSFEFKSSDGNRNIYYFKNGAISGMEFHVSLVTVKMVRTR